MNQPTEEIIVAGTIDPANYNNSTQTTDYVDMQKFQEAMFILKLGAVDSTVDFKLREAKDTGGTGEQDIAGKAITQFQATDDNKIAVINYKAEHLSTGYRYVRGPAIDRKYELRPAQ